jgi:nitronate monooxygenase
MGGVSGGALAAAVSEAGGLGLVGGGYGDPRWLERELELVAGATGQPWGVGVITWAVGEEIVRLALSYRPAAVFLSFGDPGPFGALVKEAGTRLICQVQDVAGARRAAAAGADVIVAQGTEAGGHVSRRATLPLVPAVADAVAPVPVLAAGGIADGPGGRGRTDARRPGRRAGNQVLRHARGAVPRLGQETAGDGGWG